MRNGMQPERMGNVRVITVTAPGAGAEISYAQPANCRWRFISATTTFVASAAVAVRVPHLYLEINTGERMHFNVNNSISASQTRQVSWHTGSTPAMVIGDTYIQGGVGEDIPIVRAGKVCTITDGIQGGDQWGALILFVEEWIDGV